MRALGKSLFCIGIVGLLFCLAAITRYAFVMIFAAGFAASAGERGFVDEVTLSTGTVALGLASLAGIAAVFALTPREKPAPPPSPSVPGRFVIPRMT